MTQKPDNLPAFPCSVPADDGGQIVTLGISMRDYFAAAALQGECAAQNDDNFGIAVSDEHMSHTAKRCYRFADAMLRERAREP